jgi:hypothetical protein
MTLQMPDCVHEKLMMKTEEGRDDVALEVRDSILPTKKTDLCRTALGNEARLVWCTKSAGRDSALETGQSVKEYIRKLKGCGSSGRGTHKISHRCVLHIDQ